MLTKFLFAILFLGVATIFPQRAIAAITTVQVGFEDGFIGEYSNNAHQPQKLRTFQSSAFTSGKRINSAIVSQQTNNAAYTSGLQCGFKADAKFVTSKGDRSRTYVDLTYERVKEMERKAIGLGYARRYGQQKNLELSWTVRNQMSDRGRPDGQVMMQLRVAR